MKPVGTLYSVEHLRDNGCRFKMTFYVDNMFVRQKTSYYSVCSIRKKMTARNVVCQQVTASYNDVAFFNDKEMTRGYNKLVMTFLQ